MAQTILHSYHTQTHTQSHTLATPIPTCMYLIPGPPNHTHIHSPLAPPKSLENQTTFFSFPLSHTHTHTDFIPAPPDHEAAVSLQPTGILVTTPIQFPSRPRLQYMYSKSAHLRVWVSSIPNCGAESRSATQLI